MQLIVRADAGPRIGSGHVMRSLALVEAWRDRGGAAALVSASLPGDIARRYRNEGADIAEVAPATAEQDAARLGDFVRDRRADWVVLDGYELGRAHQDRARAAGARVLAIDDYAHATSYAVDLIVNPNVHARSEMYGADPASVLCGPRYALLRREFRRHAGFARATPERASRLLVTLGGSDVGRFGAVLARALESPLLAGLHVTIVRGAGQRDLSANAARLLDSQEDMASLMRDADLALASAGGTTWELAFMQVPAVLVTLADNQVQVAAYAAEAGAARSLGAASDLSADALAAQLAELAASAPVRAEMARAGRCLIDGAGVDRVMMRMLDLRIRLRAAQPGDCRRTWDWTNAPAARAASFNPAPIPWDDHVRWFGAKIADPATAFFIAVDRDDREIGQVRIDAGDENVISISVDPGEQGRGYGVRMIAEACRKAGRDPVVAYIKPDNESSLRAFRRAGFGDSPGGPAADGRRAIRLEWHRAS